MWAWQARDESWRRRLEAAGFRVEAPRRYPPGHVAHHVPRLDPHAATRPAPSTAQETPR